MSVPFAGDGCTVRVARGEGSDGDMSLVEGCRVTSWRVSQDEVDVTTSADGGWRKLLDSAGVRSLQVELAGIYLGSPGELTLRQAALSGQIVRCAITLDRDQLIAAPFLVSQLDLESKVNEEATYKVILQSACTVSLR